MSPGNLYWLDYTHQIAPQIVTESFQMQFMYWGYAEFHPDNQLHRHSFYEACYVANRTGRFLCDGTWHPLQPGHVFLARPGVAHQIVSDHQGMELYWVAYDWNTAKHAADGTANLLRESGTSGLDVVQDDGRVFSSWQALRSITDTQVPGTELQVQSLALSIVLGISQLITPTTLGKAARTSADLESNLIRQAVLYIRDNLSNQLSISEVSHHINLSYRHFSRLFTKHMGCSFVQYINQARIENAATLLHNTEHSIKQIAEETGFHDIHYFTRVFTKTLGISPAKYRTSNGSHTRPAAASGNYV